MVMSVQEKCCDERRKEEDARAYSSSAEVFLHPRSHLFEGDGLFAVTEIR
jgi:hypothetical protein